ncbi:MAG: arylsulfatase [Blastomonas sp.]
MRAENSTKPSPWVVLLAMLALFLPLAACAPSSGPAGAAPDATLQPAAPSGNDPAAADIRPNILLIVADDLGYSDLGAYGSEIRTPHLDRLAAGGTMLTNFLAAPTCSTTRSMLLSGVDNHRNGLGGLDESGRPLQNAGAGYEGYLNFDVASVAELVGQAGYRTYMAGKWHLGGRDGTRPESRGFERSFILVGGAAAHFGNRGATSPAPIAAYREDGRTVSVPDDFFSSTFYTDRLIDYIDADRNDGRPFFAYAAYTAPHWPLQAPQKYIDGYDGVYDQGYEAIAAARIKRMVRLGLIDAGQARALSAGPMARSWNSLDADTKAREAKRMQVYAAMVESLDAEIGRLLAHLESTGELDNTVILFLSDNGPEGNDPYQIAQNESWVPTAFRTDTASMGSPDSFVTYGPGWAQVSALPFRLFKAFPAEGGIRVPAIFSTPSDRRTGAARSGSFASVLDIVPTILQLARTPYPATSASGKALPALAGRPLLSADRSRIQLPGGRDRPMGWELFGRRAIRDGDWKLLWVEPPYGEGRWTLHNIERDPAERTDLSMREPERFKAMLALWDEYVRENGVVDADYSDLQYGKVNRHYDH